MSWARDGKDTLMRTATRSAYSTAKQAAMQFYYIVHTYNYLPYSYNKMDGEEDI